MTESIVLGVRSILPDGTIRITKIKPDFCAYPVVGTPWELIAFKDSKLALQKKKLFSDSLSLIEADVSSESSIELIAKKPSTLMIFVLRGQVTYLNKEGENLSTIKENTSSLSYIPAGKSYTQLQKGQNSILVVELEQHWIDLLSSSTFSAFIPLIDLWNDKARTPLSLMQKIMTKKIGATLTQLRMAIMHHSDTAIKTANYLLECLKDYHKQLLKDKDFNRKANLTKVKVLKAHLTKVYTNDAACRAEAIEKALGWTTWTLRNTTPLALNGTITSYIHKLRIQKATYLLRNTEYKIYEIAIIVGFSTPSRLILVFKKIKGLTPTEYRHTRHL